MKTLLIFSGGLDSTSLLYRLMQESNVVRCLSFDYGQRHRKELLKAHQIAIHANVPFNKIDLSYLAGFLGGSSQTDQKVEVPEGRYDEPSMKLTVVPNRNAIMLAIAYGHALSLGYDRVAYAAHGGDHAIYPDCRPEFVTALNQAFITGNWHEGEDNPKKPKDWKPLSIYAPFIGLTKGEVCKVGHDSGAPLEMTWSCYKGKEKHCGKCGACTERREAFEQAKLNDPTQYEPVPMA